MNDDTLEKAIRERDSLARRLAGRFEETVKLRTRIEELEMALDAAEARGRQQMIDALREWATAADSSELRNTLNAVADQLDTIANPPAPPEYDYDTEGLGGT